jgi:hypothetical protein
MVEESTSPGGKSFGSKRDTKIAVYVEEELLLTRLWNMMGTNRDRRTRVFLEMRT